MNTALSVTVEGVGLPAIIDRARDRLASARSSAEVLEAKAIAEAALHFARVTKAANETHADCLRMIVRAEMRMAIEIDKGQEQGALAKKENGRPAESVRTADTSLSTLEDLGVSRQRLAEWRDVRDAGMPVVEQAIESALADGRAPTKADIQRAVAGKPHVSHNSGENEWYTPPAIIDAAREAMGRIDLDPASSKIANKVVGAESFYTVKDDGLQQTWRGSVWMNPPYAQPLIAQFSEAAAEKFERREIKRACILVNNATETNWYQRMLVCASAVCFLRGRVKFLDPSGDPSGAPLQGQTVLYLGENPYRFARSFAGLGHVLVREKV